MQHRPHLHRVLLGLGVLAVGTSSWFASAWYWTATNPTREVEVLPPEETAYVTGSLGLSVDAQVFGGPLHNGTDEWTLTEVVVAVIHRGVDHPYGHEQLYRAAVSIEPLTTAQFSVRVSAETGSSCSSWRVAELRGVRSRPGAGTRERLRTANTAQMRKWWEDQVEKERSEQALLTVTAVLLIDARDHDRIADPSMAAKAEDLIRRYRGQAADWDNWDNTDAFLGMGAATALRAEIESAFPELKAPTDR